MFGPDKIALGEECMVKTVMSSSCLSQRRVIDESRWLPINCDDGSLYCRSRNVYYSYKDSLSLLKLNRVTMGLLTNRYPGLKRESGERRDLLLLRLIKTVFDIRE